MLLLDPLGPLDDGRPRQGSKHRPPRSPGAPFTILEASAHLRMNPQSLWRWCKVGRIQASKTTGKWLIPQHEVLRLDSDR
jgi:hypothetical protein